MFSAVSAHKPENFPKGIAFKKIPLTDKDLNEQWEYFDGSLSVRNIQEPELIPIFPLDQDKNKHEAVIIAPGGAMMLLAIQHEGIDVAKHLASEGYTAFVLKYRVNPTPANSSEFQKKCEDFIAQDASCGFGNFQTRLDFSLSGEDVLDAVSFLKANSSQFGIDKDKIHYVGFSAGAVLGHELLANATDSNQPTTMACIYGDMRRIQLKTDNPPSLFLAVANDDPLFSRQGFGIIDQWRELDQSVEFHLFESGGHGFGFTTKYTTSDSWMSLYINWLKNKS